MLAKSYLTPLALCLSAPFAGAQGFMGLAGDAEGFAVPTPNPTFSFPQDHGAHPDHRIEWWYLTANLEAADGTPYGLQWTLFRTAFAPEEAEEWASPQVWFAHAAVTTPETHFATERFARGGIGQAGVIADPFEAWIDEWSLAGPSFDSLRVAAQGSDFGFEMALEAEGPLIFHGEQGYSEKSLEGQASYYYSQPFFRISGTLQLPEGPEHVTGHAWLDREWSSQLLSDRQGGWDWFALTFESGQKLMGFQLRQAGDDPFTAATWIEPDGSTEVYPTGAFEVAPLELSELAGRKVPTTWRVELPDRGVDVRVDAINPGSWMDLAIPYWEGPIRIGGSHSGTGYLEMTGYE